MCRWRRRGHRRLLPRLLQDHGHNSVIYLTNTLERIDLSERDGRTTMVARCLLNGAVLPKSLWREMVATAVFLLNRLPSKTTGSDTQYYNLEYTPTVSSAEYWDPSRWGPSSTFRSTFAAYPISTSPIVVTAFSTSSASTTLHMVLAIRQRRGLKQGACTFSLGGLTTSAQILKL